MSKAIAVINARASALVASPPDSLDDVVPRSSRDLRDQIIIALKAMHEADTGTLRLILAQANAEAHSGSLIGDRWILTERLMTYARNTGNAMIAEADIKKVRFLIGSIRRNWIKNI